MDELAIFEFLESDAERNNKRVSRRLLRQQFDPFSLEDRDFINEYRLSKECVYDLCEELRPMFKPTLRSSDISLETKVLTALSFYGNGSYQRPTGRRIGHSLAQQTVSSVISQVTACINSLHMRQKYVKFPKNAEERNVTSREFFRKFGIPGVLGCMDCTQVAIVRPAIHEERYYCGKHYHSLNVQLICDYDMQITSVDASYGGATPDSFIWNTHPIKKHLENLNEPTWLLGDSKYALRKYLMTPIDDALHNTPEGHYTSMHVKTRNIIERTIGLLKARFRCLMVHRVLHYSPKAAASIVNACVILHNICNRAKFPLPDDGNEVPTNEGAHQVRADLHVENVDDRSNRDLQNGIAVRNQLIRSLWDARDV